jgi:hypothetical protein
VDSPGADHPQVHAPATARVYWVYAVAIATSAAVVGLTNGLVAGSVLILSVVIVMATLVYRGSRVAWTIMVGAPALRLIAVPVSPQHLWLAAVEVVSVALLLAPPSVRFVWADRMIASRRVEAVPACVDPAGAAPAPMGARSSMLGSPRSVDPRAYADDTRPAGWYIDPDSPSRMRYWSPGSGWNGKTRTPRTLREHWQNNAR